MMCHAFSRTFKEKTCTDPTNKNLTNSTVQESLVYEEISDVKDTFNYTKNLLYGSGMTSELNSGPRMISTASQDQKPQDSEYEVIKACT